MPVFINFPLTARFSQNLQLNAGVPSRGTLCAQMIVKGPLPAGWHCPKWRTSLRSERIFSFIASCDSVSHNFFNFLTLCSYFFFLLQEKSCIFFKNNFRINIWQHFISILFFLIMEKMHKNLYFYHLFSFFLQCAW